MGNIEAVIAEYEREKIRMRTFQGRQNKIASGKWLGIHTPYGYKREGLAQDAVIMVDEEKAPVIEWIFRSYVFGEDDGQEKVVFLLTGMVRVPCPPRGGMTADTFWLFP